MLPLAWYRLLKQAGYPDLVASNGAPKDSRNHSLSLQILSVRLGSFCGWSLPQGAKIVLIFVASRW